MEDIGKFLEIKLEETGAPIHVKKEVQPQKPASSNLKRLTKPPTASAYGKRPRQYDNQAREVIANVMDFMKQEAMNPYPIIPLKLFTDRAEAATKVSESTLRRIYREHLAGKLGKKTGSSTPRKKQNHPCPKTKLHVGTIDKIRNIVHKFYIIEKHKPTIAGILQSVRDADIGYEGGRSSLSKVLRSIGFTWQRTNDKENVLVESYDIRWKRTEYLRAISKFRAEGRPIVYAGETCLRSTQTQPREGPDYSLLGVKMPNSKGKRLTVVHAGSEAGFIPNGLLICSSGSSRDSSYHDDMNPEKYLNWVRTQLVPNLPPNSVLVIDNASYHNVQLNELPTTASKKIDLIKWLTRNYIIFEEHLTKPELYQLVKNNKSAKIEYKLDVLLQQHGHHVLRLPPHHPEFNPIEKIWVLMRNWYAARNVTFELTKAEDLVRKKFSEITTDEWLSLCNQTNQMEKDYLKNEDCIDEVMDGVEFLSDDDNVYSSGDESGMEPSDE